MTDRDVYYHQIMFDIKLSTRKILQNFIVFEGIDGSGTTTQLNILSKELNKYNNPFWITSEPTTSAIGALIRKTLGGSLIFTADTIAHLFAADRHEHLYGENGILEHIENREIVICDRYVFSSLAYQGVSCRTHLPYELNKNFPLPGLVFYFKIDPAIINERIKNRESLEIYERSEFQILVSNAYDQVFKKFHHKGIKIIYIDASKSISEISVFIENKIKNYIYSH